MQAANLSRYTLTEARIKNRLREGRGKGNGKDYKPWITVNDLSSKGLSVRIRGNKTGRIHHLLSDLEAKAFYKFDQDVRVLDIREQFPLDRQDTRLIAENLGFRHPRDRDSGVDVVMTSDFLLDLRQANGTDILVAVSCKYGKDTKTNGFKQKHEIERVYWCSRNIRLVLFGDELTNLLETNNQQAAYAHHSLAGLDAPHDKYFEQGAKKMLDAMQAAPQSIPLRDIWLDLANNGVLRAQDTTTIFWHLVQHGAIEFDMNREFSARTPLAKFKILRTNLNAV
jgi:TnsA endonuclease N terminal